MSGLATNYGKFLRDGAALVETHFQPFLDQLERSGLPSNGLWNPFGFAKFNLAKFDDGLAVTLHVWPRGLRRGVVGIPPGHSHSFHILSRVIGGTYKDVMLGVRKIGPQHDFMPDDVEMPHEFWTGATSRSGRHDFVTKVHPLNTLNAQRGAGSSAVTDAVNDTGEWAEVSGGAVRTFEPGDVHRIRVGRFHATSIPLDDFCATFMIRGEVPGAVDTVLGRPAFTPAGRRQTVEPWERKGMAEQMLASIRGEAVPMLSATTQGIEGTHESTSPGAQLGV